MIGTPTAAAPPSDPSQDAPEACACGEAGTRSQQRLRMLRELAEIGMRLARGVERQAEEAETAGDAGLVFSRIARAVRQTLALEARLEAELEGRVRQAQVEIDRSRTREARASIEQRSRLVRRAVGQAIDADADDDEDYREQLFDSLNERLDDREHDDDFTGRPIGELVALICKDLGVRMDLSLWEDEDWAIQEAAAQPQPPPGVAPEPNPTASTHLRADGTPSWLSG